MKKCFLNFLTSKCPRLTIYNNTGPFRVYQVNAISEFKFNLFLFAIQLHIGTKFIYLEKNIFQKCSHMFTQ